MMNYSILRTDSSHPGFVSLVRLLDADLAKRDGDDHAFYAQFNKIDAIRHVVLVLENETAISCGAIKAFDDSAVEVKRMFTLPEQRGKGLASVVLIELEKWAAELGYSRCVLETGIKQPEAIRLYEKNNYRLIPNYGQYAGVGDSRCFEKIIARV